MSNDLIQKVIDTTMLGRGDALLKPVQANRFIDYMWDATVLGGEARTERIRGNTAELQKMAVGERLLRVATEAVDDAVNVGVVFAKISITTSKLRLDWELSTESLEDNIEGEALEDHIARLLATQVGNDLEDLAINGDSAKTGDALLKAFDGWRKIAVANGHVVDAGGAPLPRTVFSNAIKTLPRKFLQQRTNLRFYTGSNLLQDYMLWLATEGNASGLDWNTDATRANAQTQINRPTGPAGFNGPSVFGIGLKEVPLFEETADGTYTNATGDHGVLELTFPANRVWAITRDIKIYREFINKKDAIEYTLFCRVGVNVENPEAYVVVRNIKVQG